MTASEHYQESLETAAALLGQPLELPLEAPNGISYAYRCLGSAAPYVVNGVVARAGARP